MDELAASILMIVEENYQLTHCCIPEDCNIHQQRGENLELRL